MAKIGEILFLGVGKVIPTQPDDGSESCTEGPISVSIDGGKFLIIHGNHRYYDAKRERGEDGQVRVIVVRNPYTDDY